MCRVCNARYKTRKTFRKLEKRKKESVNIPKTCKIDITRKVDGFWQKANCQHRQSVRGSS